MWNQFKSKPLLEEVVERFQVETYRWLLTQFGDNCFYQDTQLILPTREFFYQKLIVTLSK